MTKLKHDCKTKIEHFRIQINDILVKLETNLLMDLDIYDSCLRTSILHHTQTVSAALRRLNDNYLKIQDAKLHLENENMISVHDLTTESLSKYETLYERIVKATITPLMDFKGNTQLKGLIKNIRTLGTLVKCSIPENHAFSASAFSNLCDSGTTRVVSLGPKVNAASFNIQAFASTRTDIKLPDDQCTPCVTGCSFMPNGELVICDRSNGRVKLFDHSWRIVNFVNFSIFPSGPWDISVWGRTSVIVTLLEKMQLVFIKVYPKIISGSVIQLDKQCWGLDVVGSEIYVTCHSGFPTSDGEVRVLDHNGVVKKTIGVNRDGSFLFKCPYFVTVNPASMKLFVSDYGSYLERPSTLFCLTWNGELVYKYQNPDLRNCRGLCINGDDIVMICGGHYHNVQVVRPEGTFHHTLLSSEEGLKKPCCIAVRKKRRHTCRWLLEQSIFANVQIK